MLTLIFAFKKKFNLFPSEQKFQNRKYGVKIAEVMKITNASYDRLSNSLSAAINHSFACTFVLIAIAARSFFGFGRTVI